MKYIRPLLLSSLSLLVLCLALLSNNLSPSQAKSNITLPDREEAYRANNLGVALLEQFKYKDGADAFRKALQIDPKLALARINLGIALYNVPELEDSLREAKAAEELAPDAPQPFYIMGLIAKSQNRTEDAIAAFQRVLQIDARDTGANINLGQLYVQQRKYPEAMAAFRVALAAEPYNATATYNLATALLRYGARDEGQQLMQKFQKLREGGYGSSIGQNYLEQGRYAEAMASTGAEPDLVETATPAVSFKDATLSLLGNNPSVKSTTTNSPWGKSFQPNDFKDAAKNELGAALGASVTLFDYDNDGRLDLITAQNGVLKLYHNEKGKMTDATAASGLVNLPAGSIYVAAVAGDYDNDEKADLLLMTYPGGPVLYHNDGGGKFSNRTQAAELPAYPYLALSAAFVDADHDGDLDIVIAGFIDPNKSANAKGRFPEDFAAAPNMMLRNNGNGKFTDTTQAAQLSSSSGRSVALIPTDYDNRRDVDLLFANYDSTPALFSNQRDGTFRNVAADAKFDVKGQVSALAAGDLNKDGYTDFFVGRLDGPGYFALSDAHDHFQITAAPAETANVTAAQLIDYDNDGLLDLVFFNRSGLHVLRNLGTKWTDVSERTVPAELRGLKGDAASPRSFASGDLNGDGTTDLVVLLPTGQIKILLNESDGHNRSVHIQLAGKVSNRSGVGAKVEARAGSLKQRLETYSASPAPAPADVNFGIGQRADVDAVRVLWPAGIVQAETETPAATQTTASVNKTPLPRQLNIIEVDRKPSSCPFLYAWNGKSFEFVTDFMGGGEMGYWEGPGKWNHPDPDEYVRLRDDQLVARDGRYELRVTNELEEVLYVDRLQLIAVAHPAEIEIYPNEGMVEPARKFQIFTTRGARPPLAAVDEKGRDVLPRLAKLDRQFVDDFPLQRIRGYADEHTLTLTLEKSRAKNDRTVLMLTGWTDYAFSSDNVAAQQAGLNMKPASLQVKDKNGRWQTVIEDIGIPVGRPQTVTVDLTGKFLSANREVRIVTNMRIYWDQILFDTSSGEENLQLTRLDPSIADLRWRGFSAEVTPDGREPFGYDYQRVSYLSPWKVIPGRYTREGDVRELLRTTDDMFVISRPGDEITLSFDATKLPPLPRGWKRTFLFFGDGFSKEMDINSASPDQVLPLPFHGMKSYPYSAPIAYPMTAERRAYMERYNTRVVGASVAPLEALGLDLSSGSTAEKTSGQVDSTNKGR